MAMDANKIKEAQARMEAARGSFDALWGEIAALILPRQNVSFSGGLSAGLFNQWQTPEATAHDPYSAQALEDGVSAFEGFVMPRGQRWQTLGLFDDGLMENVENRQWLEKVEKRLFALRNDPRSGFIGAVNESATSLFAYAAQSLWVDHRRDPATGRIVGLSYQSEFIGQIYVEFDAEGYVARVHRAFQMTAEQAWLYWGDETPPKVREAIKGPNPDPSRMFGFIHVIERNPRVVPGRIDAAGKPWRGGYWSEADNAVFAEGGYHSLPRIVSRWNRPPGSGWGSSVAMKVLPAMRLMQEMMRDRVVSAELALKPPLLLGDDEDDSAIIDFRPFGRTYGGLDDRGQRKVQTMLDAAGDASDARELMAEARAMIDRAFYRDLLQLNREYKSHVSAARVLEEVAEKGLLLAPLARQEDEWLSRMTEREIALMADAGWLDDMPPAIAEYFAENGGLDIRYDNQLSHMMEAGKSAAYLNLAQQVGLLAQYDPSVIEEFKIEYPMSKVVRELGRIAGVPPSMMATDAEKEQRAAADQEAAALDRLLQAAPVIAGAAKDAAAADAMAAPGV